MGYIEQNLVPGETVLYKTRLHWRVMVRPVILALFFAAVGVALLIWDYEAHVQGREHQAMLIGGIVLVVLAGIALISGFIRRNATEIAVSNMRVLIKTGLTERRSIEVLLQKVESIGVEETAFGRMLGYGTVIIRGTGGTYETFDEISHPNEFRRAVQQQIGKISGVGAPPQPSR
jgi:Bacterial PH domain